MKTTIKKILPSLLAIIAIIAIYFIKEDQTVYYNDTTTNTGGDNKLDTVKFIRCVDGDTIIVDDGSGDNKRVRMIGIDTPESVAQEQERNNEYGVMASDYTKKLLSNADTLYLEYDMDDNDQYDRILAYVWLKDIDDTFDEEAIKNYMVNALIIKNGYGVAKRYEPTVAHDDFFHQLMNDAKSNSVGLWQYEGFKRLWD